MLFVSRSLIFLCAALVLISCSESAGDLFEQAKRSHERGELSAAVVHLKGAIQQAPQDAALRLYLGRLYNAAYDGASAEKELTKALELGLIENGRVMAAMARALWLQGLHKDTIARANVSPTFEPTATAEVLAYRGHAFAALGNIEQAKDSLAQARNATSGNSSPIVDLLEANIRVSEGDSKAALAIVERVRQVNPRLYDALAIKADIVRLTADAQAAVSAYTDLLQVHPTNLVALVGRSTLFSRLGRFDEAEIDVQTLRAAYRDHFITHFQDGVVRFRKGQFRTALEAFQRTLRINKDHDHARLFEGMSHLYLGNAQSAQRSLNQYVSKRPDDLLGRRMLATALVQLNESARALEVMAPVLESGDSRPEFWEIAGDAYTRLGDLNKAAQWLSKAQQARPDDPAIQAKRGTLNLRQGRSDLALADYADAARLNKALSGADTMLVLLNLRARDFERARAAVEAMEKKAPGAPFVANLRGVVFLEQGQRVQAAKEFEQVLKNSPAFLPAAVNLARIDLNEGKVEQARKRFETVLAADKNHIQALLLLAGFEQRLGRLDEAIVLLERAASAHPAALGPRAQLVGILIQQGRMQAARTRAEEAVVRNPTSMAALELLARVATREGDKHSTVATFARMVDLNPRSPAAHVARARAERAAGLHREAESSLRKALDLQKAYAPAQAMLFELLIQQNRLGAAEEFAGQLKAELPKSPIGHIFEAEVAVFQKNFKQAVIPYQRALQLARTGDLAARVYEVRVLAGEGESALADLRRWVDDHPGHLHARSQLADALMKQGDYAGAVKEYLVVLQAAPADPIAANNLAWAYYKAGDMTRALRFAEGARKLSPDNPFVNDTLGWLFLEQGRVPQARELLSKAASMLKDRPEVRYHYAVVLAKVGEKEPARAELAAALGSGRPFSEREQAVALLETLKP
ncbi:MAG: PEP-CTERM system TPR-repeat protein PrsT [Betaproteobacteria bacterium]|nr:PEP-CTERM system TPR-repeat protein PrsT [Betaproteobacteria bacterium]